MTALHALAFASFAGALLFFAAGVTAAALWRARRLVVEPVIDDRGHIHANTFETDQLRRELEMARESARQARFQSDELATRLGVETKRLTDAEARAKRLTGELEGARTGRPERVGDQRSEVDRRELEQLQRTVDDARRERSDELEHLRRELATARAAHQKAQAHADELAARLGGEAERLADSEARAKHLAAELERARVTSVAAGMDVEAIEHRTRDVERQLAERTQSLRDLSGENEQLKGRLNDAEALRAEYVRLRTTVTDAKFLKAEVTRLEELIRTMRRDALGAQPPRAARATEHPVRPTGSIGESLAKTLDRFADSNTRATAIADSLGFPLASTGEDGNALAAYAALLLDSANRASTLLPVAAPSAVELIDDRGARIGVWTFGVERERLMLVNLAVAPVDNKRLQSAIAELSSTLAPTPAEISTVSDGPTIVDRNPR